MEPIKVLVGKAVPLFAENVDTDQIIPAEYLRLITKKGVGKYLFYRWRYDNQGRPKKGFILDEDRFNDATILISGKNFGIGSSRENAVWALLDFGIKVVISPSYGDIFYANAAKNGLLCIRLPEEEVLQIRQSAMEDELMIKINLIRQEITLKDSQTIKFKIEPDIKKKLASGLDEIGLTMEYIQDIIRYEDKMAKFLRIDTRDIFLL